MSGVIQAERLGKPVMRSFVKIANGGPRVKIRADHERLLLNDRLIYVVRQDDANYYHLTDRGYHLAGQLHEGRDF